jgi:hypothetical protein
MTVARSTIDDDQDLQKLMGAEPCIGFCDYEWFDGFSSSASERNKD